MFRKLLINFSILGSVACGIYGCPSIWDTTYSYEITEEEANEIINNYNTTEAVNNLETVYFRHYTSTPGTYTATICYIDFNQDSLYYYENTTIEYEDTATGYTRKLSDSLVLLDGDQLSVYETDYTTGEGNSTQTTLVDPQTTFSTYANNILSYLVYNEDVLTLIKERATSDITYYKYYSFLNIFAHVEQSTDDDVLFSGYVNVYYNDNGLLDGYYYQVSQIVENDYVYIYDDYYADYNVDIPR